MRDLKAEIKQFIIDNNLIEPKYNAYTSRKDKWNRWNSEYTKK